MKGIYGSNRSDIEIGEDLPLAYNLVVWAELSSYRPKKDKTLSPPESRSVRMTFQVISHRNRLRFMLWKVILRLLRERKANSDSGRS